jgi:hypothetical protein
MYRGSPGALARRVGQIAGQIRAARFELTHDRAFGSVAFDLPSSFPNIASIKGGGEKMANDQPTSLRMGFGYGQARAAGLGGIRASRSPRQVNQITEENKKTRHALETLREMAKDPEWAPYIKHRIAEGCSADVMADEAYWMDRYSRMRRRGFSVAGCLKYHWRF